MGCKLSILMVNKLRGFLTVLTAIPLVTHGTTRTGRRTCKTCPNPWNWTCVAAPSAARHPVQHSHA